ncbi:hypothetical protein AB0M36_32245 [Actinoplanes sp. NPDC051346]|uniref:hypothetical protein n=1 Tax=Actinoplanes sp. NPDC051346 TaxID=3155048 RepID=UPI00343FC795
MRSAVLVATAAVLLAPSAAQAAPGEITDLLAPGAAQSAPGETTDLLGTYGFGRAAVIGAEGQAAGLWSATRVRSGFAGDDLIITFVPRTERYATEKQVYTAIYNQVSNPRAECEQVGADGVEHRVWMSFRCRTGVAPNYTLLVR